MEVTESPPKSQVADNYHTQGNSSDNKISSSCLNEDQIAKEYREACKQDSSIDYNSDASSTKYYIISSTWMNKFLKYASSSHYEQPQFEANQSMVICTDEKKNDSTSEFDDENTSEHPGKIRNKSLLSISTHHPPKNNYGSGLNAPESRLKPGLAHGKDYALVGPSSWKILSKFFGYDYKLDRSIKILSNQKAAVEIYLKNVHATGTAGRLVILPLGGQWDIPNDIRNRNELMDDYKLNDLYPESEDEPENSINHTSSYIPSTSQQLALVPTTHNNYVSQLDNPPARKKIRKMGRCGLSNLGNTCFMNSSLQCLAHTTPLRNYFLSNEYKQHLNKSNPLGTGGELAVEFAKLLQQMWGNGHNNTNSYDHYYSDNSLVVSPRSFKVTLGRNASQFIGYDQHDSQELATYLLDALHEDTNLVTNKPYVEKTEKKKR